MAPKSRKWLSQDVARYHLVLRTRFVPSGCPTRRESDVPTCRLALRHHFLPPGWPKLRLGRGRESDDARGRMAATTRFLHLWLGTSRESDISKVRPAPRFHFLPFARTKTVNEEAMFQGVTRPCELIFCILVGPKCDLGEVEKEMIEGVEWSCEMIFCLKFDYNWSRKQNLRVRVFLRAHFLPSGIHKMWLERCRENHVSRSRRILRTLLRSWPG